MKKIVVIGGGTGTFTVLNGLRDYPLEITSVVSTADDGGSTGILRDELGVLPPGDIRQALVALSKESSVLRELFSYRFGNGSLKGHNFGNLFLSALEKVTGSFDRAVLEASRILAIQGRVIPVTNDTVYLRARMTNGYKVLGEHRIEKYIWSERSHIKELWLEPECQIHPLARQAIAQADLLVIAPGSIFTSLIPNLLVGGVISALWKSKAPMVFVANLMTEKGQTSDYYVQDFVDIIEGYLGKKGRINYVVYNTKKPAPELLERYKKEMERQPVCLDRNRLKDLPYDLIGANLIARNSLGPSVAKKKKNRKETDTLHKTRTLIRHDPKRLADILHALICLKETKKYLKVK